MRQAFLDSLISAIRRDPSIILLTSDTGIHVFDDFQYDYPENYLNIGLSEAAMIGMAAGLALAARRAFVYVIAPFAVIRCYEQIRLGLCYQNLPVTIVRVGAGLTYGPAGPTHHAIEDIAVLNVMPNMTIVCPGDAWETWAAVAGCLALPGPSYLRLGKSGEPPVHSWIPDDFVIGRGLNPSHGRDLALIATGNMLVTGMEVRERLASYGLDAGLVSMPTVKPLYVKLLLRLAETTPLLVTTEEHNLICGLGSAIADSLMAAGCPARLLKFGIPDRCYAKSAGSQEYWREQYGLSTERILVRIFETIGT